jgi:transcriptional regulator with XRE-family HTH domain
MDAQERQIDRLIGERLRQRRTERGLTQEQLASSLEVSYQQIQKYESGANRISASRLMAIARRLEIPIGFFFGGPAGETPGPAPAEDGLPHGGRQRSAIELVRIFGHMESSEVKLAVTGLVRAVVARQAVDGPDPDPAAPG